MMWKSFFRIQNFFSEFLAVPIVFDKASETFQVTPCNTIWRKIKRVLLTNLCLFAIWGISVYRLLQQLLTSDRDANFTVLDVVITSIALAFCTEGLTHIWTFHLCAEDICYILTQLLKLTKVYCFGHASTWKMATTGSNNNEGPNFSNTQQQDSYQDLSSKQWSIRTEPRQQGQHPSTRYLSKEELIMYGIAVGFNGVPLVCFLTPLMTSSDPASYFMRQVLFPNSPIIAMLAASFFQGLTAFYASLLSLNLILVCLTVVCEISAVMCTSYPARKVKRGTTFESSNQSKSTLSIPWRKVVHSKIEENFYKFHLPWKESQIRIDHYDNSTGGSGKASGSTTLENQRVREKGEQQQISKSLQQNQKHMGGVESQPERKLDPKSTHVRVQVLSPKLDNQLGLLVPLQSSLQSPKSSETPRGTASSMIMMKILEELGPLKPSPSALPMVKKLLCPPPTQRIKSSSEVLFRRSFKLYLQTKLLMLFINSAMFYYFPVVISVGMALTTLSAYATVKLHSFLPLPLRLSILLIGLTIATVMWLLMIEATEITRHSEEFLRYWMRTRKTKYTRKQLRTCQKLCFRIGPFIEFKKNTIFGVFSAVQNYTVNLAVIKLV